jgi:hypothetical protein
MMMWPCWELLVGSNLVPVQIAAHTWEPTNWSMFSQLLHKCYCLKSITIRGKRQEQVSVVLTDLIQTAAATWESTDFSTSSPISLHPTNFCIKGTRYNKSEKKVLYTHTHTHTHTHCNHKNAFLKNFLGAKVERTCHD